MSPGRLTRSTHLHVSREEHEGEILYLYFPKRRMVLQQEDSIPILYIRSASKGTVPKRRHLML